MELNPLVVSKLKVNFMGVPLLAALPQAATRSVWISLCKVHSSHQSYGSAHARRDALQCDWGLP